MKRINVLALSVLSALTGAVIAAPMQQNVGTTGVTGNTSINSTYLGNSMVPNPASTGSLPQPVNNLGNSPVVSANQGSVPLQGLPPANQGYGVYAVSPYQAGNGVIIGEAPLQGQPAWAQGSYYQDKNTWLLPFGANLFQGRFAGTYSDSINPSYKIAPGDRIVIRIWGARQYDDVLAVDQQGNIFVPEVGPISVMGITNAQLQNTVKARVGQVFTSNVEVYVNLLSSQPIGVFVSGYVTNPGQYAGGVDDSLLTFLDRAGGIDFKRGSFRDLKVKRQGKVIASYDLYSFILEGATPQLKLQDGDVIVATKRGASVSVRGLVREEALYELKEGRNTGSSIITLATPESSVSHVSVSGTRNQKPINQYLSLNEFKDFKLADGDIVTFAADVQGETLITKVSGAIEGLSHFPINKEILK